MTRIANSENPMMTFSPYLSR